MQLTENFQLPDITVKWPLVQKLKLLGNQTTYAYQAIDHPRCGKTHVIPLRCTEERKAIGDKYKRRDLNARPLENESF